eukprot:TRINITY_DN106078_c0_g1_i1.p1 TRINITY_DN106078_c0_g1~~TRINITY_DN106078_c0_g1_i1.p1  ORF type:complete len:680 (-),score=87.33 TRINITY_DN106078_c0_g1_i1:33-2072(-)
MVNGSRAAACITGTWRSFDVRDVQTSLADNILRPFEDAAWEVGFFYVIDSKGAGIKGMSEALELFPPRHLSLDVNSPTPGCLRATWAQMFFPVIAQLAQCYHLVEEDEKETKMKWDWILRLRTDIVYPESLGPVHRFDPEYVYVPPIQSLVFETYAWGYTYHCRVLDDRFALVPRALAAAYFELVDDTCTPSYEMIFNCFTPHPQYLLSWRLFREGALIRPLIGFDPVTVRANTSQDTGSTKGDLAQQSEARYQSLIEFNSSAFGGTLLGPGTVQHDVPAHAEELLQFSGPGRLLRVVLEPSQCFRDHSFLTAVRLCWPLSGAAANATAADAQGHLRVRLYRPSDRERRFWRLVGDSSRLELSRASPLPGGCSEIRLLEKDFVVAAPGDCLAYVVPETVGPLAASGTAQRPLLSNSLARVGEFDVFEPGKPWEGFAISVEHSGHLDHRFIGWPYFQEGRKVQGKHPDRMSFWDNCCDMESQGPEGNVRHCFDFAWAIYPRVGYFHACIAIQNIIVNVELSKSQFMYRMRGFLRKLSQAWLRKKGELQQRLHELDSIHHKLRWAPYHRAAKLVGPWWPAPPLTLRPQPQFVPIFLRSPDTVCSVILGPPAEEFLRDPADLDAALFRFCVSTVLTHPRILAGATNCSENKSIIRFFRDAAKFATELVDGLAPALLPLYSMR